MIRSRIRAERAPGKGVCLANGVAGDGFALFVVIAHPLLGCGLKTQAEVNGYTLSPREWQQLALPFALTETPQPSIIRKSRRVNNKQAVLYLAARHICEVISVEESTPHESGEAPSIAA